LLRQKAQLAKLQNQLKQEPQKDQITIVKESNSSLGRKIEKIEESNSFSRNNFEVNKKFTEIKLANEDSFAENLQIIRDLQSKLDGFTVELKIRGEMIVERDNHIGELQKRMYDLETQISIFKEQIAPALEQSITKLRSQVLDLQTASDQQVKDIQAKNERISASKKVLQEAKMGKLVELEDYQILLSKKELELKQKEEEITQLQAQVEQLPVICLQMNDEIKKRDSEIQTLKVYNTVLNKKVIDLQNSVYKKSDETEISVQELSRKLIAVEDQLQEEKNRASLLDKEILMLHNIIMEKESKISNMESKIAHFAKISPKYAK